MKTPLQCKSLEKRKDTSNARNENSPDYDVCVNTDPTTLAISKVAESNKVDNDCDLLEEINQQDVFQRNLTFDNFVMRRFSNMDRNKTILNDFTLSKRNPTFITGGGSVHADFGKNVDLSLNFSNVSPNNLPKNDMWFIPDRKGTFINKRSYPGEYSHFSKGPKLTIKSNSHFTDTVLQTKITPTRKIGVVRGEHSPNIYNNLTQSEDLQKSDALSTTIEALASRRDKTMFPSLHGYHRRSHSPTYKRLVQVSKVLADRLQHIPHYSKKINDFKSHSFSGGLKHETVQSEVASAASLPLIHPPPSLDIKPKSFTEEVHLFLPKVTNDDDEYSDSDGISSCDVDH